MTPDEQAKEIAAAYECVAKNGGTIETELILWTDNTLLSVVTYPTLEACAVAELQIADRGGFQVQSQAALTLEEYMTLQQKARAEAVVTV